MRTEIALATLHGFQQQILDHLTQAVALVGGEPEHARVPLAKSRWETVRLLREYQMFKHREIFEPAIAFGSPQQRAVAERMKQACLALTAELETYARRWGGTDVVSEWASYKPAMLAIVAHLRRHIESERRMVVGLLAGAERTRKLAGAVPDGRVAAVRQPPQ